MSSSLIFEDILNKNGIISPPDIYIKFRNLMNDPESDLDDFSQLVNYDAGLASRVLKIANSPLFGYSGKVDSIKKGIMLLGLSQLHDMVLGCSIINLLDSPNDIMPLKRFWQCSLFTGVFAKLLGQHIQLPRYESMFIVGLLHEIGHLVMFNHYPAQCKLAFEQAKSGSEPLYLSENNLLGFHYGQVGARLMEKWFFPVSFQKITYFQPNPIESDAYTTETILIKIAHDYAQGIFNELTLSNDEIEQLITSKQINLDSDSIAELLESAKGISADVEKALLN